VSKAVLVVAGEISGDMHAAKLVHAARKLDPSVAFFGIGGDRLRAEGVEILYDVKDMAVLGLWEVLKRYLFFRRVFRDMLRIARERKPDAALLIDYPGFNLRFAKQAHAMGIKVVYYVCPQVWAWHRSRIPAMAKTIDRLLAIFPFEPEVFKGSGLRVDYVGHPLVEQARAAIARPAEALAWPGEDHVALLPGSRRQELERILPAMWQAAGEIEKSNARSGFLLAAASEEMEALARSIVGRTPGGPSRWRIVRGSTYEILKQARAAIVTSGTATLETALMNCPMIVVYRAAWMTYQIGRRLVHVPHLGMVNLIAGRELCPEFIQDAATPKAMAEALIPLIGDTPARETMLDGLAEIRASLGEGGAAERAAMALIEELG
jgi:lipid-A-disaccharide synthase